MNITTREAEGAVEMNVALIIAGGSGTRMQQDIPKQFLSVYDKPVIVYTMEAFQNCDGIDRIVVVAIDGWESPVHAYAKQYGISKLSDVIIGGETRFDSINNGLKAMASGFSECDKVVIHDANRPLVSSELIERSISACRASDEIVICIRRCNDALYCIEANDEITIKDRHQYLMQQSPEVAYAFALMDIFQQAGQKDSNVKSYTLPALAADLEIKMRIIEGSERNFKLTSMEDIELFKAVLKADTLAWEKTNK